MLFFTVAIFALTADLAGTTFAGATLALTALFAGATFAGATFATLSPPEPALVTLLS